MNQFDHSDGAGDDLSKQPLTGDQSSRRNQACMLGTAFLLPLIIFGVILAAFITQFRDEPIVVCMLAFACLFIGTVLLLPNTRRLFLGELQGPRDAKPWFIIGLLSVFSVLTGILAGAYIDQSLLIEHSAFNARRIYDNVLPQTPALAYLDAGIVRFSQDTHLDNAHALGYAHGRDRFCVVPIVGTQAPTVIEFWAVGINCCDQRANFRCGRPASKAGLVYSELDVHKELVHNFHMAAREAGAAFGIKVSKDPMFVRWVEDPEKEVDQIATDAAILGSMFMGAYFVIAMAAGCLVKAVASS